jgi:hypothetical protein
VDVIQEQAIKMDEKSLIAREGEREITHEKEEQGR